MTMRPARHLELALQIIGRAAGAYRRNHLAPEFERI
jgi:hypothetical protein